MVPSYCYNIARTLPHWYINNNQLIYSLKIYRSLNCSVTNSNSLCLWTDLVPSSLPGTSGKTCCSSIDRLLELAFFCWETKPGRLAQKNGLCHIYAMELEPKGRLGSPAPIQLALLLHMHASMWPCLRWERTRCPPEVPSHLNQFVILWFASTVLNWHPRWLSSLKNIF